MIFKEVSGPEIPGKNPEPGSRKKNRTGTRILVTSLGSLKGVESVRCRLLSISVYQLPPAHAVPLEAIKEIRSGPDARNCREQFKLGQECEDRWLTIIYILDGNYKTLHFIAPTKEVLEMWHTTLLKLYAVRQTLMSGIGNFEVRQALWEKQYWKGADDRLNQRLDFEEVEKLCRRLNIHSSTESLLRLFKASVIAKMIDQSADIPKGSGYSLSEFSRL